MSTVTPPVVLTAAQKIANLQNDFLALPPKPTRDQIIDLVAGINTVKPTDPIDIAQYNKLIGDVLDKIRSFQNNPVFIMKSEIVELLKKSQTTPLSIESNGLMGALERNSNEMKTIALAINNLSKDRDFTNLTPGSSGSLDPKLVTKFKKLAIQKKDVNQPWSSIIGNENAKISIRSRITLPITQPNYVKGIPSSPGIWMYGPPGTGKTLLARGAAHELFQLLSTLSSGSKSGVNIKYLRFIVVSSSDILGRVLGESEKNIDALFQVSKFYKGTAEDSEWVYTSDPNEHKQMLTVLFIDEVEGLLKARDRTTNDQNQRNITQFIQNMDGIIQGGGKLIPLGATNYPWMIDDAVKRRLGTAVYIGPPTPLDRLRLIRLQLVDNQFKDETGNVDTDTTSWKKGHFDELVKMVTKIGPEKYIDSVLLKSTSLFSNSDLSNLIDSILSSKIAEDSNYWWIKNDVTGKWNASTKPIGGKNPDPSRYKDVADLSDETLERPQADENAIKKALLQAKRNTAIENIRNVEWYSFTNQEPIGKRTAQEKESSPMPIDSFVQYCDSILQKDPSAQKLEYFIWFYKIIYKNFNGTALAKEVKELSEAAMENGMEKLYAHIANKNGDTAYKDTTLSTEFSRYMITEKEWNEITK
jgi:hypothetical protein